MNTLRVLVVEDEPIVAMDIAERIGRMGYSPVGRATSGRQAIDLAAQLQPDVVLMDIRLPGTMDGITAAGEIRRECFAPVIFLTAHSEDETLARAKLVSPYSYLIKPFKDSDLKSAIEIAHHKHEAEKDIHRLNRLLNVLSQLNKSVLHCRTREELFAAACQLVVEKGKIALAWVGWLEPATARLKLLASFGENKEFLHAAAFSAEAGVERQGNPGKAVHEGRPCCCNECEQTECLFPCAQKPARFGFQSCGSFPLRFQGEVCGVISLCDRKPGFFQAPEIKLMEEVAADISLALDRIEADTRAERLLAEVGAARDRAELSNQAQQKDEQRLRALLNSIDDLVFVLDQDLVFQEHHQANAKELFASPESFVGRRVDEIGFPGPVLAVIKQALLQTLQTGRRSQAEYFLDLPGGRQWFDLRVTSFQLGHGRETGLTCVARNVTDLHRRMAMTAARVRLIELAAHEPMEAVLRAALDEAEILTGSCVGFLHFMDPDQVTLRLQTWSTNTLRKLCQAEGANRHYPVSQAGVWADCIRERRAVIHNNYAALPHRKGLPPGHAEIVRQLVVPVVRGEAIMAIFGVGNKPLDYTETDVASLTAFADLVWDIAERKRMDDELRQLNTRLEERVNERTAELLLEVAERKRAEAAMVASHQQLEVVVTRAKELAIRADAATVSKGMFLANMSHEIRTPLTAIIGYSQLLWNDASFPVRHRQQVEVINRNGEHLLALLNDILEISRIEAGSHSVSLAAFDLPAMLRNVEMVFRPKAESKQLDFAVFGSAQLPPYLVGDEMKLRQILINLVSNAVKFTTTGFVRLRVCTKPDGSAGVRLVIDVEDSGLGIAPDERTRLFQAFEQTIPGRRMGVGTGLGLAISRELARLMGGDLTISASEVRKGSTFHLTIPVAVAPGLMGAEQTAAVRRIQGIEPGQPPYKILIVDDTADSRCLLAAILRLHFHVSVAVSGREGLASFVSEQPDLILMDYQMPELNGDEVVRQIRGQPGGIQVKIIMVTASATDEIRDRSRLAGADDFLAKPFHPDELLQRVGRLLAVRYLYTELEPGAGLTQTPTPILTKESLAVLPAALRQQMYDAALRGRRAHLLKLIEQADPIDPRVSEALRALVAKFAYGQMLELFN